MEGYSRVGGATGGERCLCRSLGYVENRMEVAKGGFDCPRLEMKELVKDARVAQPGAGNVCPGSGEDGVEECFHQVEIGIGWMEDEGIQRVQLRQWIFRSSLSGCRGQHSLEEVNGAPPRVIG